MDITASPEFTSWLDHYRIGIALSTYQSSQLAFVGLKPDGQLAVIERSLPRCMGLWCNGQTLYAATLYQIIRFENALDRGQTYQNHDRLFIPQATWITGKTDTHDLVLEDSGRLVFVNTKFNCLATISETHSFAPVWKPAFIDGIEAGDRCHLNGIAAKDGRVTHATCLGVSNTAGGWRERRADGGVLMDLASHAVVVSGLSMPHSPRWHEQRLWLLNSGAGQLGFCDLDKGIFQPIAFCPGYLRGLVFIDHFAIIGSSLPRENRTFTGLPLDEILRSQAQQPICGIFVVDLRTGRVAHRLEISGGIGELYDVATIPDCRYPSAVGFQTEHIEYCISIDRNIYDL